MVPRTPPVMWAGPPGTPQQAGRTPMIPMRGTIGAPRPLTPQGNYRDESLLLTPQSLSRYRQTLPVRTLSTAETLAKAQV